MVPAHWHTPPAPLPTQPSPVQARTSPSLLFLKRTRAARVRAPPIASRRVDELQLRRRPVAAAVLLLRRGEALDLGMCRRVQLRTLRQLAVRLLVAPRLTLEAADPHQRQHVRAETGFGLLALVLCLGIVRVPKLVLGLAPAVLDPLARQLGVALWRLPQQRAWTRHRPDEFTTEPHHHRQPFSARTRLASTGRNFQVWLCAVRAAIQKHNEYHVFCSSNGAREHSKTYTRSVKNFEAPAAYVAQIDPRIHVVRSTVAPFSETS